MLSHKEDTVMNYNRKTFRFLKLEKSGNFARRKNEVEDKMLGTKLKVMEKEEKSVRQTLYQIRREKYSRSFYKCSERAESSKFVDVNVCETEEGCDENNKVNLISASGMERTKSSLRRRASVVEDFSPGQVVQVCVSSKLEDRVAGDESPPCSFPPIGKAKKRRHSVAIVTSIGRQYDEEDLFTSLQSYVQSISEGVSTQTSKDDLYLGCKVQGNKSHELTLRGIIEQRFSPEQNTFSETPACDLTTHETYNKDTTTCAEDQQKNYPRKKVSISDTSEVKLLPEPGAEVRDVDHANKLCPGRRRRSFSQYAMSTRSTCIAPFRPRRSRSYSDSSVEKKSERSACRKYNTPVPMLSRGHTRMGNLEPTSPSAFRHGAESNPSMQRLSSSGLKRRPRSRSYSESTSRYYQDSGLTEREETLAEQIITRQLEIQIAADKMRKLSLQPFGDSKSTQKIRQHQSAISSSLSSSYQRRGSENASNVNDLKNNGEAQRPELVRRHTDNPGLLRKFVKKQLKREIRQDAVEQVLSGLSVDLPDCRYLRCDQGN